MFTTRSGLFELYLTLLVRKGICENRSVLKMRGDMHGLEEAG